MWPKALPDALPSFDILFLGTDWWRRLNLLAVTTGYGSLGLLAREVKFLTFLNFIYISIVSNFVHKTGL